MVKVLMKDVETEIDRCKWMLEREFAKRIKEYYMSTIDDKKYEEDGQLNQVEIRMHVDDVLYDECFKSLIEKAKRMLNLSN